MNQKVAALLFVGGGVFCALSMDAQTAPVRLESQLPVSITRIAPGDFLLDYGRVAFGNLRLDPGPEADDEVLVRFGEALHDGRIDRSPPGSVRYSLVKVRLRGGPQLVAPAPDARNTRAPAVLTPKESGVLTPFRWVELEGWSGTPQAEQAIRRTAFDSTWDDAAASFNSSNPVLDRIWELSHYSIKASTFAGVFVDGDRERIAYEADAYLTQLGYYAGDPDPRIARATFERLMAHPTWPSEWAPHMVFMAYADWLQTADQQWLANHYEWLKTKTLADRVGNDGLVHSTSEQIHHTDIVDWPVGERDGYVFTPINTVENAFYLRAISDMAELAKALGKTSDADIFLKQERQGLAAFQRLLFDQEKGLYRDGVGTAHTSLHANLFPLAFDLVPDAHRAHVAQWLSAQGMRCSVYAAQYLMEALFRNGYGKPAVAEMTASGDRSWKHMVDSGATMTWEAWDQKYKPNQDWNHAWGAAPANLLPRFVLGVQVSAPGWKDVVIAPNPSGLLFANGVVPTPLGPLKISWQKAADLHMVIELPSGTTAQLRLPAQADSRGVWLNGELVTAKREGGTWVLPNGITGKATLDVR